MPVGQVTCTELFVEVLHELRAVVGQDVLEREGEEEGGEVEEVLGRLARMTPRGPTGPTCCSKKQHLSKINRGFWDRGDTCQCLRRISRIRPIC